MTFAKYKGYQHNCCDSTALRYELLYQLMFTSAEMLFSWYLGLDKIWVFIGLLIHQPILNLPFKNEQFGLLMRFWSNLSCDNIDYVWDILLFLDQLFFFLLFFIEIISFIMADM